MGELDQSGTSTSTPMEIEQFVASGRNGRRNAMADLGMSLDIDPGAYKLAEQMSQLETSDGAGCSGSQTAPAGSSGSATATSSGS
uniref:Uncharacterized protein n=1 Tax=Ditylenchus dipsaci TaxID=166011 RepID=A0A915EU16_9BILA